MIASPWESRERGVLFLGLLLVSHELELTTIRIGPIKVTSKKLRSQTGGPSGYLMQKFRSKKGKLGTTVGKTRIHTQPSHAIQDYHLRDGKPLISYPTLSPDPNIHPKYLLDAALAVSIPCSPS